MDFTGGILKNRAVLMAFEEFLLLQQKFAFFQFTALGPVSSLSAPAMTKPICIGSYGSGGLIELIFG
jgi:hypothetical protein